MYNVHQIEKLNFWLNSEGARSCYSLTYNEKSNVLHVFNHAFPKTHSLYTALETNSKEFVGKIRNQMKFAIRRELPTDTRIFYYDRNKIIFEWDLKRDVIAPLPEDEWYLLYNPYLKPLPKSNEKLMKGRVRHHE